MVATNPLDAGVEAVANTIEELKGKWENFVGTIKETPHKWDNAIKEKPEAERAATVSAKERKLEIARCQRVNTWQTHKEQQIARPPAESNSGWFNGAGKAWN